MRSQDVFPSHFRGRGSDPKATITFGLLAEDHKKIIESAYLLEMSVSGFVRESVAAYMNRQDIVERLTEARDSGKVCPPELFERKRKRKS